MKETLNVINETRDSIRIFGASGCVTSRMAIVIAFATVSWQSLKAALANPVDGLKSK